MFSWVHVASATGLWVAVLRLSLSMRERETIDHTSGDVAAAEVLRRHPAGAGTLLDAVRPGNGLPRLVRAVRDEGTIVSVLSTPGPGTLGRGLDVSTVYLNDARAAQLQALADSVANGRLPLPVSATCSLADAPAAITAISGTRKPGNRSSRLHRPIRSDTRDLGTLCSSCLVRAHVSRSVTGRRVSQFRNGVSCTGAHLVPPDVRKPATGRRQPWDGSKAVLLRRLPRIGQAALPSM